MNGYESSTILCTIVADPKPIAIMKKESNDISGCDIRVCINQTQLVDGKWTEHPRFITLTAWYYTATKLLKAKWCKKGYHALFLCKVKERVYEGKEGPAKALDYEILDAQPVLVSASANTQQNARNNARVESERAPQDANRYTNPNPAPTSLLAEEDIPF
jgi:hypothetical protein